MLTLAVVASRNGGRIPAPVLDRLRDQDLGAVPFDASEHLVWSNEAATVWFGGWQSASADRPSSHHWHVDDEGLTAFAGHLWSRRGGWPTRAPWAAQLAEHLRVKTLTERTDDLAGVYVAAALHQVDPGAHRGCDAEGPPWRGRPGSGVDPG